MIHSFLQTFLQKQIKTKNAAALASPCLGRPRIAVNQLLSLSKSLSWCCHKTQFRVIKTAEKNAVFRQKRQVAYFGYVEAKLLQQKT